MPDLNRDRVRSVWRAGPQPRSCEASVVCTSRMSQRMSEDMSEKMSEDMSNRMSEDMSERSSERMSNDMSEDMSDRMSKDMSDRMSKDMTERMSERMSKDMSERMSEDVSERMSEDMSEDVSERMSEDVSERMSEDMSERMSKGLSEDMSERMSKDMSERMSEDKSEDMSERMSKDMSEDMSDKTNSLAMGNAAKLMLCHLMWRTAANTCGSTFRAQASEFGLAAMSELVVERPATIFIGTSSRFAKGVGYVWSYVLTMCMDPPSTTHAADSMFIVPEVEDGTLWHVVYERRAVRNEEGRQELEQRAAVFRTVASFWDVGVHEWQINVVLSRASYTEEVPEAQWQTSDFMLCTRHEM